MWLFDWANCCCRKSESEATEIKVREAEQSEVSVKGEDSPPFLLDYSNAEERKATKESLKARVKAFIQDVVAGIQVDIVTGDDSGKVSPALLKLDKNLKTMVVTVFSIPGGVARIPFDNLTGEIDRIKPANFKSVPEGYFGVRLAFDRKKDECFFTVGTDENIDSFTIIVDSHEEQQRYWACLQIIRVLQAKTSSTNSQRR